MVARSWNIMCERKLPSLLVLYFVLLCTRAQLLLIGDIFDQVYIWLLIKIRCLQNQILEVEFFQLEIYLLNYREILLYLWEMGTRNELKIMICKNQVIFYHDQRKNFDVLT